MLFMGIDGGGSAVRVVIGDDNFRILHESVGGSVNPSGVGRTASAATLQTAIKDALAALQLEVAQISAVGIGVAGAEPYHSAEWMASVICQVLPSIPMVHRSDHEVALVGAHGERRGLLILAGTGSLASGVGRDGDYKVVGARGYLLGDEGSGYWLGSEAVKAVIRADDRRGAATALVKDVLTHLQLRDVNAIVPWLFQSGMPPVKLIAGLAPIVLQCAESGDKVAHAIVTQASHELALALRAVHQHLQMENLPIAFAGSLLTHDNILSRKLCQSLELPTLPLPKFAPSVGGLILARDAV
jgi:N-acetylglucosamine kinase-like BadF-type ATPase